MECYHFFLAVSQGCISSLFVMLTSLWMEFLEHKTELLCFFSPTEGTDVVVNSIDDDVGKAEDERTGA